MRLDFSKSSLCTFSQGASAESAHSFTQEDINQGRVIYHQQTIGSNNDSVQLSGTNGITEVGPFRVDFDIVPMLLPLQVNKRREMRSQLELSELSSDTPET